MSEQTTPAPLSYIRFSIELIACPFFTYKEKEVLCEILSLSYKFINKGGCNRTNKNLAFRHRLSPSKVSNIITLANRLGFIVNREDDVFKRSSPTGKSTLYSTERKIIMEIPEEWKIMGDLYNGAFVAEDMEIYKQFCLLEEELKQIDNQEITQEKVREILFRYLDNSPYLKKLTPPTRKKVPPLSENLQAIYKGIKDNKSNKEINTTKGSSGGKNLIPDSEVSFPEKTKSPASPERIMSLWNKTAAAAGLSQIQKVTARRQKHISARLDILPAIRDWRSLFSKVENSPFLTGDNPRGWVCSFDWLIENEDNPTKVMEDKYNYKEPKKKRTRITNDKRFGTVYGPPDKVINNGVKPTEGE